MTQCSVCHQPAARYRVSFAADGSPRRTCNSCLNPAPVDVCSNPFGGLTLEHAVDESGEPVHVTSLRQLRAAEQRYGFKSVVVNSDAANFDTPPDHGQATLMETMTKENQWLYPEVAEAMIAEMRELGELQ